MQQWFILTLVLLGTATLMAAFSARFKLPPLLGYLFGGAVLGPSLTGILQPGAVLDFLAELGVILLLFMVGLEFSVKELWATRRQILVAGGAQTVLATAVVCGLLFAAGAGLRSAVLLGGATAMSSTALTAKQLAEQGELTTRHGRAAIAMLVFQDIATIPLLSLLSIWGRGDNPAPLALLAEVAMTLGLFVFAVVLAKPIFHRWLGWVARHGSAEVFLFAALMLVVGTAFLAYLLGLSAAIGAFLAGVVLGESDFRHRVEDDLRPFRDVLMGLFFITVGAQLDVAGITRHPAQMLLWLVLLIPLKMILTGLAARVTGLGQADATRVALILGHGGEFGLLLIASALGMHIAPATLGQPALTAMVLSMGLAPFLIKHHDALVRRIGSRHARPPIPLLEEEALAHHPPDMQGHIIICGASELGMLTARALDMADIRYLLVESEYEAYKRAKDAGYAVLYGDASSMSVLKVAGAGRAIMVVITVRPSMSARRIARALRQEMPELDVIATSVDERDAEALLAIPGVRVYVEKIAAGLALAEQALLCTGLDAASVDDLIGRLRLNMQKESNLGP